MPPNDSLPIGPSLTEINRSVLYTTNLLATLWLTMEALLVFVGSPAQGTDAMMQLLCNTYPIEPGCEKNARSQFKCVQHGGGKRCSVDGCGKSAASDTTHAGGKRCSVDGCGNGAVHVKEQKCNDTQKGTPPPGVALHPVKWCRSRLGYVITAFNTKTGLSLLAKAWANSP